jgi:hypothetical protein
LASSAADARVVVAVEKLLQAGCVLYSAKANTGFYVEITEPACVGETIGGFVTVPGNSYSGFGMSFTEAFNDAYRQLPEYLAVA